jgi:hypothetical protein
LSTIGEDYSSLLMSVLPINDSGCTKHNKKSP